MTLVVVADQHIGASASLGDRLADQRASWLAVCEKAVALNGTVLHAGDVFNARRPTPVEMHAYQDGLDVLRAGNVEMIIAAGNHDVQSADAPTAVEVASAGYAVHVCREPEVIETPDGAVGFLPWMPPRMSAKDTAEALMIVAESLAEQGARILIAHWAIAGGSLPNGLPLLELAEPMLDPYRLAGQFEFVLAGHIHKRQVLFVDERSSVVHIGPLSRGNFGEADVDTGACQIESDPLDLKRLSYCEWFEVPDRAFVSIDADARGLTDSGATAQVCEAIGIRDLEGAIVRVSWQQTADQQIDQQQVMRQLAASEVHHVDRLQPIVERVVSTRSEGVTDTSDPRESFDRWLDGQPELASETTLADVREQAHERIGRVA